MPSVLKRQATEERGLPPTLFQSTLAFGTGQARAGNTTHGVALVPVCLICPGMKDANQVTQQCMTMIHPATGWFKIVNIPNKRAVHGRDNFDNDLGWQGVLSAARQAMHLLVHTTNRAMPTHLVFGCITILNVAFEANWQYIKERQQQHILCDNKHAKLSVFCPYHEPCNAHTTCVWTQRHSQ